MTAGELEPWTLRSAPWVVRGALALKDRGLNSLTRTVLVLLIRAQGSNEKDLEALQFATIGQDGVHSTDVDQVPAGVALVGRWAHAVARDDHPLALALWMAVDDQLCEVFFTTLGQLISATLGQLADLHQQGQLS